MSEKTKISPLKQALIAVEEMQQKIKSLESGVREPVAIIGMGCKFPKAGNPKEFWDLLINGKDAITDIPIERWDIDEFYDADSSAMGKMSTRSGGFLEDIDKFDPQFFGISPREAVSMDPQQRVLMEVVWQAFENYGILPENIKGTKTGVFIGVGNTDYVQYTYGNYENNTGYTGTGNANCINANRLSYFLDIYGPSLVVDTACSSSLVATHLAVKSLQTGESKMAIAGGVNLILSPDVHLSFSNAQMMAADGRCKTFDEKADGYVRSEGAGVVILKRLDDALKDGDNILAVIRGSASNQDGRSNGITAPNSIAQVKCIKDALHDGNVQPEEISYVEAHGTGTKLGDPIELKALAEVFSSKSMDEKIILGAVKSNIGHLEAAAGIAGLIKIILCLENNSIPKNLNFNSINPLIPIEKIPFSIPRINIDWEKDNSKRISGVSSFGFGGTNAHLVIEESPNEILQSTETQESNILSISAKDEDTLEKYVKSHEQFLNKNSKLNISDYCYTASLGRTHFDHRASFSFSNRDELISALKNYNKGNDKNSIYNHVKKNVFKVAFLFTGQGSQYLNMGKDLYKNEPVFKEELNKCNELSKKYLSKSLFEILFPESDDSTEIHETMFTQSALFSIEYALAKLWMNWGIMPNIVLGHSIGEFVAAVISNVFSLEDGFKLVAARGKLMQSLPKDGSMAVVFADSDKVLSYVNEHNEFVSIAAENGPANTVISGDKKYVSKIIDNMNEDGIRSKKLTVSHAFHSPLMNPILHEFEQIASAIKYNKPAIPFVSNVTGKFFTDEILPNAEYWKNHIRNSVKFMQGAQLLELHDVDIYLEIGPSPILTGMAQTFVTGSDIVWANSLNKTQNDNLTIRKNLGLIHTIGYKINWKNFYKNKTNNFIYIPTYPYKKERYWIETAQISKGKSKDSDYTHPLVQNRIASPITDKIIFETRLRENDLSFIRDHKIFGKTIVPATAYIELAYFASQTAFDSKFIKLSDLELYEPIAFNDETDISIQIIFEKLVDQTSSFEIFSQQRDLNNELNNWNLNAKGKIDLSTKDEFSIIPSDKLKSIKANLNSYSNKDIEDFYSDMREHGFEHGHSMRLISEMWCSETEALGKFNLKQKQQRDSENYLIHPALLDSATHLFAALKSKNKNLVNRSGIYLPVGLSSFKLYKERMQTVWGHIKSQDNNDKEDFLITDIEFLSENDELVAEIKGMKFQHTSFEVLSNILDLNLDDWLYKIQWQSKELPKHELSDDPNLNGKWLIFDENDDFAGDISHLISENGGHGIQIKSGEKYEVISDSKLELRKDNVADYNKLLALSNFEINGIIYFSNSFNTQLEHDQAINKRAIIHNSMSPLICLLQSIIKSDISVLPPIYIISVDHTEKSMNFNNLLNSLLTGFIRTLKLEYPELNVKKIGFNNNQNQISKIILDEMIFRDNENEIRYDDKKREVARLSKVNDTEIEIDKNSEIVNYPHRLEILEKGLLENLKLIPIQRVKPETGFIEIAVRATGLNFRDVLNAMDLYPGDAGPLGGECSGIVSAIGEGVTEYSIGDEVLGIAGGSFSTHVHAHEDLIVRKPENISFEEAASIPIPFLTAYYSLKKLAKINDGDSVLIHAATGGVGLAAIQIARLYNAKIFGTAGNDEKRSVLREEKLELIMNSRSLEFVEQIKEHTKGIGVDIVLNSFSGDYIEKGLEITAKNGRFLEIGKIDIWDKKLVEKYRNDIDYHTIAIDDLSTKSPKVIKEMLNEIIDLFNDKKLIPIRNKTFEIDKAVDAFRFMQGAHHIGKIIIKQKVNENNLEPIYSYKINENGAYLITGGRGALGLVIANWLIRKGAKHLVLLGRSDPNEELALKIDHLKNSGVKIHTPNCDVSNYEQLNKLFNELFYNSENKIPLLGIIHAAGVLDDGVFIQQDWVKFNKAYAPKVYGAWNLHELTKNENLDFMIYFSSIASLVGSPGQSNYASANSFLDSLAHYRRSINLPAQSINWGPWDKIGMAAGINMSSSGIDKISQAQGLFLLDKIIDENHIQMGVLPINWNKFYDQLDDTKNYKLFERQFSTLTHSKEKTYKIPELVKNLNETESNEKIDIIRKFLSDKISKILGLSENTSLDIKKPLSEMGIDSLMGLEIKKTLDVAIGKNLPATLVFNYPNVESIAKYIHDDVLNYKSEKENDSSKKEENLNKEVDEIISDIEELSDEEVEAQLLKKLNSDELDF